MIRATVDGVQQEAEARPGASLLSLLRDGLGVTAPKNACEEGECGACSVWLDGELVCSCLVPAFQADGATVRTVASLARDGELHPVQDAFLAAGAVQCGFCTPGMVAAAVDLLEHEPQPNAEQIARALEGNLCRCTGYAKVTAAVRLAAEAHS